MSEWSSKITACADDKVNSAAATNIAFLNVFICLLSVGFTYVTLISNRYATYLLARNSLNIKDPNLGATLKNPEL